jgi:hypothetical protein
MQVMALSKGMADGPRRSRRPRLIESGVAIGRIAIILSLVLLAQPAATAQWIKKKVCKNGVTVFALKGIKGDQVKGPNGGYTVGTLHMDDVVKVRKDSLRNKRFAVAKAPRCGKWANGRRLAGVQIGSIKNCPTIP